MSRRIGILVANSNYNDTAFSNLFAPVEEARALRTVLLDHEVGAFDQIELIENESKSGVERALETLLRAAGPEDLVLLYFSGHGELSRNGRLYLAVSNSEATRLASTAVSTLWLRDLLDECDAASIVILLDCCYGGAYLDARKASSSIDADARLMAAGDGRYVITATSAIEQAEDGRPVADVGRNRASTRSVFTGVVLEGLSTGAADLRGLGRITAEDLGTYVRRKVLQWSVWQTPAFHGTSHRDVVLARVRSGRRRQSAHGDLNAVRLGSLLGKLEGAGEIPLCATEWRRRGRLVIPIGLALRPDVPSGETVFLDLGGPGGHVLIVGKAGSGKSTVIRSLICAIALTHSTAEAIVYGLESGGNRLGSLQALPHIRRVVGDDEESAAMEVLQEVRDTIAQRKLLFREHDLVSRA